MKTVKQILREYLEANGYDGLLNEMGECGCERDDICPCDEGINPRCVPAYKVMCGKHYDGSEWIMTSVPPVNRDNKCPLCLAFEYVDENKA